MVISSIVIQEELSEVSQFMNAPAGSDLHQDIEKLAINALSTQDFNAKHITPHVSLANDVQITNPRKGETGHFKMMYPESIFKCGARFEGFFRKTE